MGVLLLLMMMMMMMLLKEAKQIVWGDQNYGEKQGTLCGPSRFFFFSQSHRETVFKFQN